MTQGIGRDVFIEVLRSEGVRHVFGNPGSTELPLIDAMATTEDISYALALQEATAVAMADGYAQVTRRPALLNLHTSAGLGNAVGNLTNAVLNRTPLVVTAGQQDTRHILADPLLSGDLTGIAAPVAKWTHEVRNADEIGPIMRRAFQDAVAPPRGPVFVSLPMDLFDEPVHAPAPPRSELALAPTGGALEALADLVASPEIGRLALIVSDELSDGEGTDAAVALAEALGAPVHGAPLHGTGVFPPTHPLWAGPLAPAAAAIAKALSAYDRVLLLGGQAFRVYPYTEGSPLPETCELLHVSGEALLLGRAHAARLGVLGDPAATAAALVPLVRSRVDAAAAAAALDAARTRRDGEMAQMEETALGRYDTSPVEPMAAAHALLRAMPAGTPVVDEAITTGAYVRGFHHDSTPGRYFFTKGGGLGWGMPAALGVSLGLDRAPVLSVTGDGAAMYSPQALWTAAREQLPIVFAVVNNRQYLILKNNLRGMGGDAVRSGRFVAMDLDQPAVDYVGLAASMGVDGTYVEKAADIGDAVKAAVASGKPHLIEIPITAP
jgi:benzoylformate decarboxylase